MVPVEHAPPWTLAVIGADGFIGSAVTRRALAEDGSVTAVCVKHPWRLAEAIAEPGLRIVRVPSGRWWEAGFVAELAPAAHGACRALKLDGDTLAVEADAPIVGQELVLHGSELAAAFSRAPGGAQVRQLRVTVRRR